MNKAPIAFFAYNRPEHTKKALESLSQCEGAEESELFIFCDGSKKPEDEETVKAVRILVKSRKWCSKVNIIERDKNFGLANSIISGVTEIVDRFGTIIVLEDDIILSKYFLDYMNKSLGIFRDQSQVMQICGYMHHIPEKLPETFFFRKTSCWGWATWQRAWSFFSLRDPKTLIDKIKKRGIREFNLEGNVKRFEMLKDMRDGRIDSWAILWAATVFLNNGLALYPGKSLVKQIGFDGTGEHCRKEEFSQDEVSETRITVFPQEIIESAAAAKKIIRYYKDQKPAFFKTKRMIMRAFSKLKC